MSKELEALETLKDMLIGNGVNDNINDYVDNLILPVKQALLELKSIKEAYPSEALELVDKMANYILLDEEYGFIDEKEKQAIIKDRDIIKQALHRLETIENTFADSHICEIQKEFAKYDKLCEETKCEECALGVGDGICLRKTFERKWELQKEVVSPNSVNLLMQELGCKDMETLRKYARCGYERLNNFKGSKEVKIEIPESSLMDYNPVKKYLKWEDLEFKEERQEIPVRIGETIYTLVLRKTDGGNKIAKLLSPKRNYMGEWGDMFYEEAKQFFNDLHLERVKE